MLREQDLEETLQECRGTADHDCVLCLSGGKDSIYLLYKLVYEYKLKVLAYTNSFDLPSIALRNIETAVKKLNVDHLVHSPPFEFYKKFIRHLLQNQEPSGAVHTVCYFWLDIREGEVLRLAVEKKIPLILAGYAPGQPDPDRMFYEMPQERISSTDWTPRHLFDEGLFKEEEASRFWNPLRYPRGTEFPRFLAPFHAWKYDQEEVMRKVVDLGLIPNRVYAHPLFSNFTLNWLFMYLDLKNLGYNPYAPEFCQLIREGKANLSTWRFLAPLVDFMILHQVFMGAPIKKAFQWLELKPEDLKI